jgi:hypothetical protein
MGRDLAFHREANPAAFGDQMTNAVPLEVCGRSAEFDPLGPLEITESRRSEVRERTVTQILITMRYEDQVIVVPFDYDLTLFI